ncbi:MAG: hypothetical protein FWE52_02170 [Alphaproteobacteria bacterium]|nr:hypothetical protein [Alphaproteobacteria bacterium]
MKARTKRKLFYTIIGVILAVVLAVAIVPPFINLDRLAPEIESAVLNQTGIRIKIGGPVRVSLLGRATVTANDVSINEYRGRAESISFYIPFSSLRNINTASINSTIVLHGAHLHITSLAAPANIRPVILIRNSSVTFMDKTYDQINGVFRAGMFNGTVRTDEHKYTLESDGGMFRITNPNVNLDMVGQLATESDGSISAAGHMSLDTSSINKWFGFDAPRIRGRMKFQSDFIWANSGFNFYNISGQYAGGDFSGEISFGNDQPLKINLLANDIDYDFAHIANDAKFLRDAEIIFSANGKIKSPIPFTIPIKQFAHNNFSRFHITMNGDNITDMRAESANAAISASGNIASGLDTAIYDLTRRTAARCELYGTGAAWGCRRWDYKDANFAASGTLMVSADAFDLKFESANLKPEQLNIATLHSVLSGLFGRTRGTTEFRLENGLYGTLKIDGKNQNLEYFEHSGTTLSALPATTEFLRVLPESMMMARGNVKYAHIQNGKLLTLAFARDGRRDQWSLGWKDSGLFQIDADARYLLSAFYPNLSADFLRDELPANITGYYKSGFATDMNIAILNTKLTGKFDGKTFDLRADTIDLDEFINPNYIANYESAQYITEEPSVFPFALNINITLVADNIKFRGEKYENFVYSLKSNQQTMSITDAARGSMLLSITKKLSRYAITIKSNRFEILGLVLSERSPLNVADTTLTARADLETTGITAHDFWDNMAGEIDITFEDGILVGFDIDRFYGRARDVTRMNAEWAISDALSGGDTRFKSLRLVGQYENGRFRTTTPMSIVARHSEIAGNLQTANGIAFGEFNVLLRGTSPTPVPIQLRVHPNGGRDFSLSEIMRTFDPDFMREFTRMHDRF